MLGLALAHKQTRLGPPDCYCSRNQANASLPFHKILAAQLARIVHMHFRLPGMFRVLVLYCLLSLNHSAECACINLMTAID
jgi:hypothetical protein